MIEYIKQDFGKKGSRMNPKYEPPHVFTVIKCDICGEYYEADRLHLCRTQNSYPYIEESEEEEVEGNE